MNTRLVEHGNKKAAPDVPARVKAAAEYLALTPGPPDYAAIAKAVGYRDAHAARQALSKPQSIRYLREHKDALLEHICAHNPERLRRIADAEGGNAIAKVAAVRGLELMKNGEEATGHTRSPAQSAGITTVIESGASARVLNPPTIEPEPTPHTYPSIE
jgi:hypothetical protein